LYLNGIPYLNYATLVYISLNGGALCGVHQGAQGGVSSARQVWEANATRDSDSEPALCENMPSTICRKCRYDLLRLEKLKKEYEEVKS